MIENMQKEEELTYSEKKRLIKIKYGQLNPKTLDLNEISYRQKIYLLTLFRVMTDEEFDRINPLATKSNLCELSPSRDMDKNILKCLYTDNVILVDQNSKPSAFNFELNSCVGFKYVDVAWNLNVSFGEQPLQLSTCFEHIYDYLIKYFPTSPEGKSDAYSLTMSIALNEVESYLLHKSKELNYEYFLGRRTSIYIYQLLNFFSVSKIYTIIDLAIGDAHLTNSRYGLNETSLGNYIALKMLEIGELAIADKMTIKDSARKEYFHRSELSKVFYELIHSGGDEGFFECPKDFWNKELASCYEK